MGPGPFFIVGSARSGTTLLRVIFNAHPGIAVPPESRFVTELWRGSDEVGVASFLKAMADHPQFRSWGLPIDDVRAQIGPEARVRYPVALAAAYRAYAIRAGKTRWGDKTPRYVESIPLLDRLFPDARIIHLVRDGRNVALSYANVPFGPKTVAKAASLWARRVMQGVRDGRPLGGSRYRELRYEDLVSDPERHVRELCAFIEIEFSPDMMEYTEKAKGFVFEKARTYNPRVLEKPTTDVRSWKDEMPAAHIEVFEAVAGEVLDLFGYERLYANPRPSAKLSASLARVGLPIGKLRRVENAG